MKSPQLQHFRCHFFTKGVDKRLSLTDVMSVILGDVDVDADNADVDVKAKTILKVSYRIVQSDVLNRKPIARWVCHETHFFWTDSLGTDAISNNIYMFYWSVLCICSLFKPRFHRNYITEVAD